MPGLPFKNLPNDQVQEIKRQLSSQWEIEANALNQSHFTNEGAFKTARAKLNAKYQQLELESFTELNNKVKEQERVRQLIQQRSQGMSPEEEVITRMNLNPEQERLVFPTVPEERPYSIATLESPTLLKTIKSYANAAPGTQTGLSRLWPGNPRTKEGLMEKYQAFKDEAQYNLLNNVQQRQLDSRWDAVMASNSDYNAWWHDKEKRLPVPEIKALRTKGPISRIMQGKIISPVAQSIIEEKPKEKTIQPKTEPIYANNPGTGQRIVSYDNGGTWQPTK